VQVLTSIAELYSWIMVVASALSARDYVALRALTKPLFEADVRTLRNRAVDRRLALCRMSMDFGVGRSPLRVTGARWFDTVLTCSRRLMSVV
jgi:hypothetical protein